MFQANISDLRSDRQDLNYRLAIESNFEQCVNNKAFDRLCKKLGMTKQQVAVKASQDKAFATVVAMAVAINASRQGTKDEAFIVEGISREVKKHGIDIRNYTTNEKVPIRESSQVLSRAQAKRKYDSHLLMKSFDFGGKICDNKKIEGFAKVCIGAGGHQDNVFHEASEFLKWAAAHGSTDTVYAALIDTDQKKITNNLKRLEQELGNQNLWVVNHKELQERLISLKSEN
tara:strand:- start:1213 stop:1902 length:690 start_codon:yes stop_codon:yes gene_type:complete